jgi:hypothetical protein
MARRVMARTIRYRMFLLLVSACVLGRGCAMDSSDHVVIDKKFLRDIPENPSWGLAFEHYPELVYLAMIGDRDALEAGIKFVTADDRRLSALDIDMLGRLTFEQDTQFFWEKLATLGVEAQLSAIEYYDYMCPLDWVSERDEFLSNHEESARRYAESQRRKNDG